MFMDCYGVFSSILEGKEDKYLFWELFMNYEISYVFYKENIKFFHCIQ